MKFIIFTVALLIYAGVNAQQFYFRHYEVENGLSNNTVFSSIQDRDGFMWFGTKDGLNRFDGYHFKTVPLPDTDSANLSRDLISALAVDSTGRLWVGSEKGLYRYDARLETLIPFMDSLKAINDIYVNSKGELWFISAINLHCYNFKTQKSLSYPSGKYFEATSICETASGEMWFASTDGYIHRFNEDKKTFTKYSVFNSHTEAQSRWISRIVADQGSLFVGTTSHGIKVFSLSTLSCKDILPHNENGTAIHIRSMIKAGNNEYWFATESGLFIYNTGTGKFQNIKKRFLDPYSLSDNAIYTLYKDREGGIWAGTFFGGINYLPNLPFGFKKYYPDYSNNTIGGSAIREICEDKFGNLWIGSEDAGISRLNPNTKEVKHFFPDGKSTSISNSNIHALLALDNKLWIGTFEHGLNIMDIPTGRVIRRYRACAKDNCLKSDFIVSLLQTKSGILYIGTSNGLFKYNKSTDDFTAEKNVPPGGFIEYLMEDSNGNIWVSSHNEGVFFFHANGSTGHFRSKPGDGTGFASNYVNSIFEDSRKNLWFSTDGGGLCELNAETRQFARYTTGEGLASNTVYMVLEDNNKYLWITTSRGLTWMNAATHATKIFNKADGLVNDQFNYNSGYKDKEGNLYLGSVRGLVSFNPRRFDSTKYLPPVYLTEIKVHGNDLRISKDGILKQSIQYTDHITLPYDQSSLSLDFSAVSFSAPEKTIYRYRLLGLDTTWVSLSTHQKIYFTKLIPGEYTLQMEAAGNLFPGPQQKKIHIHILPPIWSTQWAYFLYSLFAGALLTYIIHLYHKIQENKKAKAIYDAKIEFFTNITHEIRTPLTLIKGPVDNLTEMKAELPQIREDVLTMERNTTRLINLVNQILDFRKVEAKGFSLDFKEVNLTELLKEIFLTFEPPAQKKKLEYTLHLPTRTITLAGDEEALTKILSNLLNNAVKYAEKKVSVTLRRPSNKEDILIEVRNDGVIISNDMKERIFEPFFRMKETKQKGTGMGLALARSLAELHKGKLYLDNESDGMNTFVFVLFTNEQPD